MVACFIGHEDIFKKDEIKTTIENLVNRMIIFGYNQFLFSGNGEFDKIAYDVAKKRQNDGAQIKLIFCYEQNNKDLIDTSKLQNYDEWRILKFNDKNNIKFKYDKHKNLYLKYCAMIENSDFSIFCVGRSDNSSEFKALHYAVSNSKKYFNVYSSSI